MYALKVAVFLFGLTVLLGAALLVSILRRPARQPSRLLVALHGHAALFGLGALLAALSYPATGAATGTQSFRAIAAVLLFAAAGLGLLSLWLHWRRRSLPGGWVGAHVTVAITGYVLLAVYLLAG